MKVKKIEEKIIESIDVNEVPSVEEIKNRMDFSKHPFKERETKETNVKRKMVFGCLVSSLCTLIICLVCMCVVINHNLGNSSHIEDVLSNDEINTLLLQFEDVNSKPIFYSNAESKYSIYVYECYNKEKNLKEYYYKINFTGQNSIKIYINGTIKLATEEENFGRLLSTEHDCNNQRIEFEVEYKGTKKYYCFTN